MIDKNRVKKLLSDFIALQSVSSDSNQISQLKKTVSFLSEQLRESGFIVRNIEREGNPPLVIATRELVGATSTIGIYGHYDVQAPEPLEEWRTEPFHLVEQDGKFYGRGVADNKGHIIQNLVALQDLIAQDKLRNSVIIVLEGEEETGSVGLEAMMEEARNIIQKADVFFITDTGMHAKNCPQIFYALRGLVYFEVSVTLGKRDLHSGIYGNAVINPANVIMEIVGSMKDSRTGEVTIPGFYDSVREVDPEEYALLEQAKTSDDDLRKEAGAEAVQSLKRVPAYLSPKILPSLDVNGIVAGHIGEGAKTIIPRSACVKFSARLVEHQNPEDMCQLIESYIRSRLPAGLTMEIKIHSLNAPFYSDYRNNYTKHMAAILEKTFRNPVMFNRSGGSIPAAEVIQRLFGIPIILTGFTLPDDNIHAPNENFDIEMFWKGIEALREMYGSVLTT